MPRALRKTHTAPAFDALTVEGALIAPAMLALVGEQKADRQTEADYGIPKGLTLRDEIARAFRIGQALFAELRAGEAPSAAAATRFVEALLRDAFGFGDIIRVGSRTLGEYLYPLTLEARGGRVPIVVVPPSDDLDAPSAHLPSEGRRRSAASAVQDWLNASDGALWGLCANGLKLRLVRDNSSLTRPAYIEADLRPIFESEAFADFALLWLLIHASRFGLPGTPPSDCALEHWREAGGKEGIAARERLREGVEAALSSLGSGFLGHPDNAALRARLADGTLPLPGYFGQLLRLVYRLIFLFAAEDCDLLHPPAAAAAARRLYAEGYALARLRERAVRRAAWDRHRDQWEGLRIVFAALAQGEPRLGLPALGGLFVPGTIPDLEEAHLANRDLMAAIYRLAWLRDRDSGGLVPVNWRDMQTEELGSVYESLLELTPRLSADGRAFSFAEGGEAKGNARKTTGSYYTPDSLVQVLLDSALDPVLDRVEAEAEDTAQALLSVKVIDPACGSGHFLLAAARRIATRLAHQHAGGVAAAEDYRHALREVARSCIYGVDRNPLAVELTKVALWIETVEPGKPLGFLDANIRVGDSLLGVFDLDALRHGIPDAAYRPLTGDDPAAARYFARRNKDERAGQGSLDFAEGGGHLPTAAPLAAMAQRLRAMPEDSPEEIAEKRRRFAAAQADPRTWNPHVAADLYTAAFLMPKTGGAPANSHTVTIPTSAHVWQALAGRTLYGPLLGRAQELACEACAFHWPLGFPDVMAGGGFDVVLGNPPWERIKLQEQEFFAARDAEIANAPNAAARGRLIARLKEAEPGTRERALYEEFETAKRTAEAASVFARVPSEENGRFLLTGRGDVNTYALFAELFASLASSRGRAGMIVPTGIATDATTAPFLAALVGEKRLVQLIDFENRARLFPAVDSRMKFSLLTIGRETKQTSFAFYLTDPRQLVEPERRFTLSVENIARINPNTKTAPVFRSRADAELTAKIYARLPVLIDETKGKYGNPWGVSFMRMFDMTNDSPLFSTYTELETLGASLDDMSWILPNGTRYLPLYEPKMFELYNHRAASYASRGDQRGYRVLPDTTEQERENPWFRVQPYYWVAEHVVHERLINRLHTKWVFGFKDITSPTNERTFVCTVAPIGGFSNKMPLIFVSETITLPLQLALIANLSSLPFDYVTRQKVGGVTLNYFLVKQFPVVSPDRYSSRDLAFIVPRVLELVYTSWDIKPFAEDAGCHCPPFSWDPDRRTLLRAELDAYFAHLYGLTCDELRYILDPSEVLGSKYPSETFRVLKDNEFREFGEYRTGKQILDAWVRLRANGIIGGTRLDVPCAS